MPATKDAIANVHECICHVVVYKLYASPNLSTGSLGVHACVWQCKDTFGNHCIAITSIHLKLTSSQSSSCRRVGRNVRCKNCYC